MTREEAAKYIKERCIGSEEERDGTKWSDAMWIAIEALSSSEKPTADRPKCEWIEDGALVKCKNCGEVKHFPHWRFCPNCGAEMERDTE